MLKMISQNLNVIDELTDANKGTLIFKSRILMC